MFKGLDELEREVGGERKRMWEKIPLPLKFFVVLAVISYIGHLYLAYSPPSPAAYPRPGSLASFVLAYCVCPVCILTPTVDPTPADIAYFIGPLDALVHGAIGAAVGYIIEAFL